MQHYDASLIAGVIHKFVTRDTSVPVSVLFDADNTLYKFSTYTKEGIALREMYTKGFYKNLSVFPEAPIVVENLQRLGISCGILTGSINSPWCKAEKMESFNYYFPMIPESNIIITEPDVKKTSVVDDIEHKILIDDYYGNICEWYEAGGLAIKKSYSGKARPVPVITSLIDLFSVLHELNVY